MSPYEVLKFKMSETKITHLMTNIRRRYWRSNIRTLNEVVLG